MVAGAGFSYRPDIDGLRALAVLPVVAFHAGMSGFSGGYVGVDVFFVISGYLITSILWREMEDARFSFRGFYMRRAKRILPALYVVLGATLAAGYFLLPPFELRTLSESALSVLAFGSNLYFWTQSGYFGPTADQLPLLHTWSVSVEEQFYLLFPALLLAVHRFAQRRAFAVLCALLAVCFAASAFAAERWPTAAFYLLPTRAWELLLGAALALAPQRKTSVLIAAPAFLAGIAMIVAAVALFDAETRTPGWPAALPCVGAALAIWAGAHASAARFVLDNPLTVWIGRISYSMYLWHWPLVIFMPNALGERGEFSPAVLGGYFAALLALSSLSYLLIEQPFRRGLRFKFPVKPLAWATAASALIAFGVAGAATGGFPQRLAPMQQRLAAYAGYQRTAFPEFNGCFVSIDRGLSQYNPALCAPAQGGVFVWGDSAAAFQMPGLRRAAAEAGLPVAEATMSACRPSLRELKQPKCTAFNAAIMALIERRRPSVVVLSARWNVEETAGDYTAGRPFVTDIVELAHDLRRRGFAVVVFGPPVQYREALPPAMLNWGGVDLEAFDTSDLLDPAALEFEQRLQAAARQQGLAYFSIYDAFCQERRCRAFYDGAPTTWDAHHVTDEGADYLAERAFPIIAAEAAAN